MYKLRFAFDMKKLPTNWQGTQVKLVGCMPINIEQIMKGCPSFIKYDTERTDGKMYNITFRDGLLLTFIHLNTGKPFTTIRENKKEKFEFYMTYLGEIFMLEKS